MLEKPIHTPVALIIFNRPELTQKALEAIALVQPPVLYVIADGPRTGHPSDAAACKQTRALVDQIPWDCQVIKIYADNNLGCRERVSSGLDWVFNHTETAIVLEDDCIADPTFFHFCEQLLERYRDDTRVMAISGDNFQRSRQPRTPYSYYFSRYPHCWGWATWRRAWQCYDNTMALWPNIRDGCWLYDLLESRFEVAYWRRVFQKVYDNQINSWAFRWTFACWLHSGLAILPRVNLVSNIGFSSYSTHTRNRSSPFAALPVAAMPFPLKHPPFMIRDVQADRFTYQTMYSPLVRARAKLRQWLP
ncbi:hypothetical protein XM38_023970 [Halomicronema hongdechloris C2206]|uniref:Hemolytic protein HlpA-like protein n=1 Tax=Halomicronema hongdechloris C2206 TaxID=1641165 RepID=A0A1Z3HME4_9CYAN|nr:hemolytic protein HlpA-like protein [Halomicronema hongdechloris]ASC71445.1 hypothetical protein XM38_023970 [Halomicronema hongdechloris C2206]